MAIRPPPDGASFIFESGIRTLSNQIQRADALDNKAAVVLAVGGVLAGLLFDTEREALRAIPLAGLGAGIALLASLLLALWAFWTRRYSAAPRPEALAQMVAASEEWIRWRFLGNVLQAVGANRRRLDRKARVLSWSLGLLVAHVGTLGGYWIWRLWNDLSGGT
jgi:hypothetical protein